ncbi:MAG: 2-isopropylmalate synthase [Thermoplasmata archaeon]|nr:2-isopropylmalate synthase [Thermoplasmata archaeon]
MIAISPYNQLALPALPQGRGRIQILDTTLRDGEQAPGIALSSDDKVRIAGALDDLGVDFIEAGFAVSSDIELETIKRINDLGLHATVLSLARSVNRDIDAVAETGVDTVHTFIGTSDLHRRFKLKMTKDEIVKRAVETVEYARSRGLKVQFSCEDATRTELDYLIEVYSAVAEAGACAINVPDTVGVIVPQGMNYLVGELAKHISVPISVHCHNDLGLATANSLAAIESGATIVQGTIGGIGERTGNVALEEVAINLFANYGIQTVDLAKIGPTARLVERITGFPLAYNKPLVGRNAFSHESGIHVHGVMSNAFTYEPLKPELIGTDRHIVIGKHSGEHSVAGRLKELGIQMPEDRMPDLMAAIKAAAIGDKEIDDNELAAIVDHVLSRDTERKDAVTLDGVAVLTGKGITSTATVNITISGEHRTSAETGVGPVDAAIRAIAEAVGGQYTLEEYKLAAINGTSQSLCEVTVMVRNHAREGTGLAVGKAVGPDVVQTSIDAMVAAVNRDLIKQ